VTTPQARRPAAAPAVEVEPRPLPELVALHLLPGALTAVIFYATAPLVMRAGFPAIAAGMLAAAVGIVGVEMGWLLHRAHRLTGRWALAAVLPYRPSPFGWRKGLLCLGLLVWGLAAAILTATLKTSILESLFDWMPTWAVTPLPPDTGQTTPGVALLLTAIGLLFVNVLAGPIVEELYFRGYLLPRLARLGVWAPLVNVTLFALYHLWKPWDFVTLVVILTPMVYAVWYTRDIRVGIAVHVTLNGLGYLTTSLPTLLPG
jgi:uncharacterized protein